MANGLQGAMRGRRKHMLPVHGGTWLMYIASSDVCPTRPTCFMGPTLMRQLILLSAGLLCLAACIDPMESNSHLCCSHAADCCMV